MSKTVKLRVGTDCSGIEAPIFALKNLKVPFHHVWSCEYDKFARLSIAANHIPDQMYEDITTRDHSKLPEVDIYVCGFPCQPFSSIGKHGGMKDTNGRIMFHCIEVIRLKQPKIFILENVSNFKIIHDGKPFESLMKSLNKQGNYNIYVDTYNTLDYGIPQHRKRIYVVGIKKSAEKEPFKTPLKRQMAPIERFYLDRTMHNTTISDREKRCLKHYNGLDFDKLPRDAIVNRNRFLSVTYGHVGTCTTNQPCFIIKYKRYATPQEYLLLQGFPKTFKCVVSNTQLMKQAGNAMSVNVVQAILAAALRSTSG